MKALLTSGGVANDSIRDALVELLGKPIAEASALCIPTAIHALSIGPALAWEAINDWRPLDWRSFGLLELAALPTLPPEQWRAHVAAADALLVGGGDPLYLHYWMRQSGLADLLPALGETVYVGLSAGSMIMAPRIGEDFVNWRPPAGGDETLGLVDFAIFPHLDHPDLPDNTMANAEKWAAGMTGPRYTIDDQTAIKVVDGAVEVISEGQWRLFAP